MLKPLAILFALSLPAHAQEVLAEYQTDSGSLGPEYAWDTTVSILSDGQLTLKHCRYAAESPSCKTRRATVPEDALAAIRRAASESGLAEKPARDAEELVIGGGLTSGAVYLDGTKIDLLPRPAAADVERVEKVLDAIAAAIPRRFDRFLAQD